MTTTVFDLEAVGAVAVPLFSWPPSSSSTPARSAATGAPGTVLASRCVTITHLSPTSRRGTRRELDAAPTLARPPRPRCLERVNYRGRSYGRCQNRTWCGADLCPRHGGPTQPLPVRAADPTRLPKRVRYAAGLVEDLEFMRATGESWLGACARLGKTPAALERWLYRHGCYDLVQKAAWA